MSGLIYFEIFQPFTNYLMFFLKIIFLFCIASDYFVFLRSLLRRLTRPVLQPQMGFQKMDPYLKEAIQVFCLFESLRHTRTKRGMIAAITQYLQAHIKESLPLYIYNQIMKVERIADWTSEDGCNRVEEMIEEAFGETSYRETEEGLIILDTQDGEKVEMKWHEAVDCAFTNWKEFRNSTISKKFTNLINVVVTAGMCATADLTFKIGNVTLFTPIVAKKQLGAGDVFEAFYEAISGFMKGGWRVFHTGEVSAFFMEDDKVSEFDKMYNDIRSWHGYALAGNLREYTEIDDNEYESRLKKAIEFGDNLLKFIKTSQTFERKYISDRMDRLRDHETEFTQLRTRGGLRIMPFSVCLFGQSGCGKSSLTNLTINAGLLYNGLSADKDRIATWADNDRYASSVRSHINAIIFDDFANTKEDFMDFSPAYRLIQVINNIRYLAPMADVFLKGKVSLNPYFCLVSTNVEHLNAAKYSNEPESVLRRLYHVKVEPKPQFCENGILNKALVEKTFGQTSCPDVWYLTVRTYVAQNKRHVDLSAMKPIIFEGKTMTRVSVRRYLKWVQVASKSHFTEEGQYIANQEKMPEPCEKCSMLYCDCPHLAEPVKFQMEEAVYLPPLDSRCAFNYCTNCQAYHNEPPVILEPHCGNAYSGMSSFFYSKADRIKDFYIDAKETTIIKATKICEWWERFDCLPEKWICHPTVLKFGLFFWREDLQNSLITGNSFFILFMLLFMLTLPRFCLLWLFGTVVLCYWYTCTTIQVYQNMVRERILELKNIVNTFTQQWQFKYAIIGLGAIGIILATMRSRYEKVACYSACNSDYEEVGNAYYIRDNGPIWRRSKITKLSPQTGLNPENIDEVQERNDKVNPWLGVQTVPLPMSEPSKTTIADNLASSMKSNIIGIISDIGKTTLGFYIASNLVIIPTHYLKAHNNRDLPIKCYKNGDGKVGSVFKDKISNAFRVDIPLTDFTLCYLTSGGSMKDFRKFLPEGNNIKRCPAKLITREICESDLRIVPMLYKGSGRVAHTETIFPGSYYNLPIETQAGMCMSPIISDAKGSMILGFHLGGKGKLGGCGTLTLDQINFAMSELGAIDGVVLSASSGVLSPHMGCFPTESFGETILEGKDIHPKSAVNFLTDGAFIDIYGTTSGKATPHSNVAPTLISDAVEEVFGVPQQWGAPKMKGKGKYPYQATLVHAAVPSLPLGSVLSKAVSSIKELTTGLKTKIPELFKIKPLSRVATVSGMTGVKFIDPMNFSSSPGFPLSGSKHPLVIELEPSDYPDIGKPRTFVPEVWDEFDKIVSILKEGKRCYMIWKSCLKDEPTKLTKDKVRVFQSAPLVLQLLIRMYFLPIVRIIQMNPILYECAVGVNAEGLEWEELWEAAMSKGRERVLAGDYSKYDIRMPAQVTIAAFDILIDIAERCDGYTPEDIHVMKMVVHEVVYPVMAYNGDLIQLFGTNPSGQNLTVIINSLVNSLLLRSCFFTIYPEKDFKENCSFLTYGDDVIGTVSETCNLFTHISFAAWLAEHDMKFTMPDKESEPTHYMTEAQVDFLKRSCQYLEDLGRKVGVLSEDSIFKRLHSHLLSKELTLPMHSAQNIESSLHDWFYYGREIFEDRRAKLRRVAQMCDIEHLCPSLEVSYDKRVNHWRHKYLGEELEEDEDEIVLDPQCGDMFVSTVDFKDHCIGTATDPFYWWEHICADLSFPFLLLLWYKTYKGSWKIKIGFPHKFWIYLIVFTTGGLQFQRIITFLMFTAIQLYYGLFVWVIVQETFYS